MLMKKFKGINNVLQRQDLAVEELAFARNIDLNEDGTASRRDGFAQLSATQHANVWEAPTGLTLATRGALGDLVNVDSGNVLVAGLGHARLWYCPLPDGRVAYSNAVVMGGINELGSIAQPLGVPIPATLGAVAIAAGGLYAGSYQYALTHTRASDGVEGGATYSMPLNLPGVGGFAFTGLPVLAGYRTNVYLTSANGGERFYAGSTVNGVFAFSGSANNLMRPLRTDFLQPPPPGKLLAFWRARLLVAIGSGLYASRPHSCELFNLLRDFKPFGASITLVQPVDGGIWVGTEDELAFLAGDSWDKLQRSVKVEGPVVLGSGCTVPGVYLQKDLEGDCMVCVADGWLVVGTSHGQVVKRSQERYRVTAAQLAATFRVKDGTAQYIAIEQ